MKIIQINIRSLNKNKDMLEQFLFKNNVDVALLQETWQLGKERMYFNGYQHFNRNRRVMVEYQFLLEMPFRQRKLTYRNFNITD